MTGPAVLIGENADAEIFGEIDRLLADYEIRDAATLRTLLQARLDTHIASGDEEEQR